MSLTFKTLSLGLCLALLAACGGNEPAAQATPAPAAMADAALQKTYDASCKTCHSVAGTGAPLTGDAVAWQPRAAQGLDTLLDHTIDGYQTMPPMGLCPQCSEDDFVALISYMSGITFE